MSFTYLCVHLPNDYSYAERPAYGCASDSRGCKQAAHRLGCDGARIKCPQVWLSWRFGLMSVLSVVRIECLMAQLYEIEMDQTHNQKMTEVNAKHCSLDWMLAIKDK